VIVAAAATGACVTRQSVFVREREIDRKVGLFSNNLLHSVAGACDLYNLLAHQAVNSAIVLIKRAAAQNELAN
jgi:hypothetical protein